MKICGMKITHDGGIALVDGDRLVFSVEVEKLGNGHRYAELERLETVEQTLRSFDVDPGDIDAFVIDGWGYGESDPVVHTTRGSRPLRLPVAPYREQQLDDDSLRSHRFSGLPLGGGTFDYTSYHHTTGHVAATYCASPFGQEGVPSFVLVWDGGVLPRCYYVRPEPPFIENLGPVFGLMGNVYATYAMHFPPFRPDPDAAPSDRDAFRQLSVPGKVMAYVALGEVRDDYLRAFDRVYEDSLEISLDFARVFTEKVMAETAGNRASSADALASFQHWVGRCLVDSLRTLREQEPDKVPNLCFTGGCALNIKWNSTIRASGVFDRFWVPPFPNDSGAALGAACAGMLATTGGTRLDWSVFRGPALADAPAGGRTCEVRDLARLLHETGKPVVVLHGAAELGPRALGNRSIIAPATDPHMRDLLNRIKNREDYRPVSPICLAHRAPDIFDPGTPDPYMLFDHRTRPQWTSRIPAVVHLDGTARLQTVTRDQNPVVAELLEEYERLSGVPVLCNTSANLEGRGFFPDVDSALEWGRTRFVWSKGRLWERATNEGRRP